MDPVERNSSDPTNVGGSFNTSKPLDQTDVKTYSLARKIFEGLALIFANIFTIGLINVFNAVRNEYGPVFSIKSNNNVEENNEDPLGSEGTSQDSVNERQSEQTPSRSSKRKKIDTEETSGKAGSSIDLDKVFPANLKTSSKVKVDIPEAVQKSLDIIFGIEDVVGKMPVCSKIVDDSFSPDTDLLTPIMKATDKFGAPCVFIKLKAADPEAYYEKSFADADVVLAEEIASKKEDLTVDQFLIQLKEKRLKGADVVLAEEIASKKEDLTVDQLLIQLKEKRLKGIEAKTHIFMLAQAYYDRSPLLWKPRNFAYLETQGPAFLFKRSLFYEDQITYEENGGVVGSIEHNKIPEFQKLFNGEGIGTDVYGNRWVLALD